MTWTENGLSDGSFEASGTCMNNLPQIGIPIYNARNIPRKVEESCSSMD